MRKKLLAGVMALALCSTNMSPQTIFAGEFTSGNLEEVTEETPEIFSDDNQEVIEETEDELSVFSSESVPEFSNEANVMPATVNETKPIEIDLTNPTKSEYYNYDTNKLEIDIINGGGSYRFKGSGDISSPTKVPILIRTDRETNIYLNNVYIVADLVPALDIQTYGIVNIYLENNNFLETQSSNSYVSALKMEFSFPTIYSQNNSGSLTVSSTSGTGIRIGSSGSLTINGGSVTASSADETEKGISSNQITINGGSVKASSVSSSPKNTQGDDVYCCTIENPKSEAVIIDRNPTSWEPKNHQAVDPLYAWLTGETHTISVGNTTQTYYFDKNNNNNEFKPITNWNFTFTKPSNLTYDGTAQKAPLKCNIEDIKDEIKLSYYNKDDGQQSDEAINAGTYTVTANIAGNSFTDSSWTFTIYPALEAPGYTTQTQIPVLWSCKKISDITNPFPADWKWDDNVNPDQELQVGKPITATAIYNGNDKGNYEKESITYTITRKECEHKNTVGRYYSSPSCTSSGYSGDTYCNDCKRTIYYGSTIPAYGHDYDNGVITTEPTIETDGIITYTCKRCKHQDTKNLGKLGDGEPYIEGSFQKKGWDAVNDLIKASKEKDTISIILNGAKILPASVLSEIKGKDISLNLDM